MKEPKKQTILMKILFLWLLGTSILALSSASIHYLVIKGLLGANLVPVFHFLTLASLFSGGLFILPIGVAIGAVSVFSILIVLPTAILRYFLGELGAKNNFNKSSCSYNSNDARLTITQYLYLKCCQFLQKMDKLTKPYKHELHVKNDLKKIGTHFLGMPLSLKFFTITFINICKVTFKNIFGHTKSESHTSLLLELKKLPEAIVNFVYSGLSAVGMINVFLIKYLLFSGNSTDTLFLNKGLSSIVRKEMKDEDKMGLLEKKAATYTLKRQQDYQHLNEILLKPYTTIRQKIDSVQQEIHIEQQDEKRRIRDGINVI